MDYIIGCTNMNLERVITRNHMENIQNLRESLMKNSLQC